MEICTRFGLVGSTTTGTAYYDDIKLSELKGKPDKDYCDLNTIKKTFTMIDQTEETEPGKSFLKVPDESREQGYDRCVFSSITKRNDDYFASPAQRYIWEQVLKKDLYYSEDLPFYYIALGPPPDTVPAHSIKRFGPFRVYKQDQKE